jgi:hypothetical protein
MTDVTRRFNWGVSVQAILDHFLTRELKELRRHCKKLIDDFRLAENGEGYRCTIISFEMFEYGFLLSYNHLREEWVLEVVYFPNFGSPECKRKLPRAGGKRRGGGKSGSSRRTMAWLRNKIEVLYKITAGQIGRNLTLFLADTATTFSLYNIVSAAQRTHIPYIERYEVSLVIERFRLFAEQQSRGCDDVVQLVRAKVDEAVSFLGPLSSFALPSFRPAKQELWPAELFGPLEHATSG